jgi:hypothetical protein
VYLYRSFCTEVRSEFDLTAGSAVELLTTVLVSFAVGTATGGLDTVRSPTDELTMVVLSFLTASPVLSFRIDGFSAG